MNTSDWIGNVNSSLARRIEANCSPVAGPDVGDMFMSSNEWNCDLMTVEEITRVLHVPVSWVYGRTRRRGAERIPHVKLGKYLRFEFAKVRYWLNGKRSSW
jgi:hypothetical protein